MPAPGLHAEASSRLRPRSLLLVAPDAGLLDTAYRSGADALAVDLVSSDEDARANAAAFLAAFRGRADRPLLMARVNTLRSGLVDRDLAAIMAAGPAGIILPGTVGGRDVAHLGAKLAVHEAEHGLEDGTTRIVAAVESAAAVLALPSLPGASPRLSAIAFDSGSLAADLGAGPSSEPVRQARSMLLLAARAAGIAAIDDPSPLPRDPDQLTAACRAARFEGFAGKLARDPGEVPVINAAFG
jgi:citrate lyase subunit beta/citryl-CoA lyase